MPSLQWQDSRGALASFELSGTAVAIGRGPENDLVLPFGFVSSRHARLSCEGGRWRLHDLGSTNGTTLNGAPGEGMILGHGDTLQLGSLEMKYLDEDAPRDTDAFGTLARLSPDAASELEKLSLLLDLQAQWEAGITPEATIQRILESVLAVSGAERACLLLRREAGFRYSAGRDDRGSELDELRMQPSRSVVKEVVERGKPVFMTEGLEGNLAEQKSVVAMNLRAVGCVPLHRRTEEGIELLGVLYLDSRAAMHALSGLDEKILLKLGAEAESVLERIELVGAREERRRMERELELARQTQKGLLPHQVPEPDGWRLEALCRPTRQVGGDFYDFIPLPDGRPAAILADVSGKGIAASLVSSSVQGALQMVLRDGKGIDEAFRRVSDYLCERSEDGRFVTVFAAILGPGGGVEWSSAGHNPAYLFHAAQRRIVNLESTGVFLGALPSDEFDIRHATKHATMAVGDVLVIYSDGLTEATGPDGELFGEERLLALLERHGDAGSADLRRAILEELEEFTRGLEQSDDITMVIAERRA